MDLPTNVILDVHSRCLASPKAEVCGIIDSDNNLISIKNVAKNPECNFVFDRREYFAATKELKASGLSVKGIYHTHPSCTADPSEADLKFIEKSKTSALIVSPKDYRVVQFVEEVSDARINK